MRVSQQHDGILSAQTPLPDKFTQVYSSLLKLPKEVMTLVLENVDKHDNAKQLHLTCRALYEMVIDGEKIGTIYPPLNSKILREPTGYKSIGCYKSHSCKSELIYATAVLSPELQILHIEGVSRIGNKTATAIATLAKLQILIMPVDDSDSDSDDDFEDGMISAKGVIAISKMIKLQNLNIRKWHIGVDGATAISKMDQASESRHK